MIDINSFFILGGDLRQLKLAQSLYADGFSVCISGFDEYEGNISLPKVSVPEGLEQDCIVLPLPLTKNGDDVAMPFSSERVSLPFLFGEIKESAPVLAGLIPQNIHDIAASSNTTLYDYFDREEIMILNAIPTAEGAIQIALEEMSTTLHGSRALVLGFGRVGKVLAQSLDALCCRVDVAARKHRDFAWIRAYGYNPRHIYKLGEELKDYDVIFNTVPHQILDKKHLAQINNNCIVIDLASKPGGVDFDAATRLGTRVIWALSLPGKVAPVTAALAIKEAIYNLLTEEGYNL